MTLGMEVRGWTPEREAALRRMWLDGLSASQIARALGGGATRNAVIGKMQLHTADRAFVAPVQRPRAEAPARVPRAGGRGRRSAAEMLELARQHTRVSASLQREPPPGTAGRVETATVDRRRDNGAHPLAAGAAGPEAQRLLKSEVWLPLPGRAPVPLGQLEKHGCKWPVNYPARSDPGQPLGGTGDPREPGFGFCGLPQEHERTSYCAVHRRASIGGWVGCN